MRKLRTFYGKVTEFLNDDKITCLQRLRANVRIGLYRRAEQTVYLYSKIGYLCKQPVRMWYAYIKHHKHIISLTHTSSTKKSNRLSPLGETGER